MGWTERNLHDLFQVSPGVFSPAAYTFPSQATRHVVYFGGTGVSGLTGRVRELYAGPDEVWHDGDLLAASGGPQTGGGTLAAYLFALEGTQHVLYQSTVGGDLLELYWDGEWHAGDLHDSAGAPSARSFFTGIESTAARAQIVAYQGSDSDVHVLSRKSSGDDGDPVWVHHDLTAEHGGQPCVLGPAAYVDHVGIPYLDYIDKDDVIREFTGTPHLTWSGPAIVGSGLAGPDAHIRLGVGYGSADGSRHVPVADANGDLWEYVFTDHWEVANLTGPLGAPHIASGTTVAGYDFPATDAVPGATRHLVYTGVDGLIHELWQADGAWRHNPLTTAASPRAAGTPSAFVDLATSTQNVFYLSASNEVVELRWTPGRGAVHTAPGTHPVRPRGVA